MNSLPTHASIRAAHERIRPYVHRTPVISCQNLNQLVGTDIFFKCDNLQKAGAFKSRGACNAVFSLNPGDAQRGVATHSSGNHAGALARAAQLRGIPAHIVMPSNSPNAKVAAVKGYAGEITFCEPSLSAREQTAHQVISRTGATLVHPYDDYAIIAGQATAAIEFIEDHPDLDILVVPVGGGGLLAGTLIAAQYLQPSLRVIAAEPAGADDAYQSWKSGILVPSLTPRTLADGLLTSLGKKTFPIIQDRVDNILRVTETKIIQAMHLIFERAKLVVEPSAAVTFAALLEHSEFFTDKKIGLILSGGNVDLDQLPFGQNPGRPCESTP